MNTFITFFYDINGKDSFQSYMNRFAILIKTGANFIAFIDDNYFDRAVLYLASHRNVVIVPGGTIASIRQYFGISDETSLALPIHRNLEKDTLDYLLVMNYKTVAVRQILSSVVTPYVAWIDFGIDKIFKYKKTVPLLLRKIRPISDNKVTIPGSWLFRNPINPRAEDGVQWRFLGGFFIGTKNAAEKFAFETEEEFRSILSQGRASWEVNIWSRVEWRRPDLFDWYEADHDDTIFTALGGSCL